jgi:hypothetical protein
MPIPTPANSSPITHATIAPAPACSVRNAAMMPNPIATRIGPLTTIRRESECGPEESGRERRQAGKSLPEEWNERLDGRRDGEDDDGQVHPFER